MSHHAVLDLAAMGAYGSRFSESGGKHETTADWRAAALDPDGGRVCRCGGAGGGVRLARRRLRRGAHDTWHASISHNCNNPSFCGDEGLGGGWGSVEFDCFATGTITGSGQFTGCGHFQAGGGAFHATIVVTAARIVPAGPDDPNPGGRVFFVEHNVVNGVPDDPDFLGDTGIPVEPGHYSDHPAPGVANMVQVTFTPAT